MKLDQGSPGATLLSQGSKVRAAIDTSYLSLGRGGITRYILCLLDAFKTSCTSWLDVRTITYPFQNHEFRQPTRMLKTLGRELIWQPFVAPRQIRSLEADVFHAPFTACVRSPDGVPKIATLHDLAYIETPERFRRWTRLRIPIELKAYSQADYLICPSRSTADDAMRHLGIPASRIEVIYHGCHFGKRSPESAPERSMPAEFFLFVSSLESGKNLRLLNDAWRLAEREGFPLPPLVIVGKRVEGVEGEGPPPSSWIYLGRTSDEELVWLYRRSLALIYPSKFEGFGFPVVEAMSLETAVICSPVSSLPEVGGDAAYYSDLTPEGYFAAARRVMTAAKEREERIQAGVAHAARFRWDTCAAHTAGLYSEAARRGPR